MYKNMYVLYRRITSQSTMHLRYRTQQSCTGYWGVGSGNLMAVIANTPKPPYFAVIFTA